jgi:glucokinase
MATRHRFPWLVADIGGTNTRFGLVHEAGAAIDDIVAMKTNDFATVEDAARSYLSDVVRRRGGTCQPHAAAFAFAGTGLGVAGVLPTGGGAWVAVRGEGGHVTASAADDFEADVLRIVRAECGHVSAERILSGVGLPNLHQAVMQVQGRPRRPVRGRGDRPAVRRFFARSRFRERFEAKGRFQPYLAAIATALVTTPYPAMIGAAHAIETRPAEAP